MSNPHKGDVPYIVGDTTYTLRYSHLALVKLEKLLDKGVVEIMAELERSRTNLRIGTVVALLWAGLQKHHPKLSFDDVAELLDDSESGAAGAMEVIGEAFQKAFAAAGTQATSPISGGNGIGTSSLSSTSAMALPPEISGISPRAN